MSDKYCRIIHSDTRSYGVRWEMNCVENHVTAAKQDYKRRKEIYFILKIYGRQKTTWKGGVLSCEEWQEIFQTRISLFQWKQRNKREIKCRSHVPRAENFSLLHSTQSRVIIMAHKSPIPSINEEQTVVSPPLRLEIMKKNTENKRLTYFVVNVV